MWLMLQQDQADDYVIATGETHSVREFLERPSATLGLDWKEYVKIDPQYYPPRRKSTCCSAMPPRRGSGSAGSRR